MKRASFLALFVATQLVATISIQLIIVRNVGIGAETDSFIAAQSIALVLASVLQAGLQSYWLPKLSANTAHLERWKLIMESAIWQSFSLSFVAFGMLGLTASLWMPLVFSAFEPQQLEMTRTFFYIFSASSALTVISYQLTIALRTRESFLPTEALNAVTTALLIPIIYNFANPGNLVYIASILATRSICIITIQLKLLSWPAIRVRKVEDTKDSWKQMQPVLVGASFYKTLPLIDRSLVALAPPGGLTIFNLAQTGVGALSSILERSLCAPITAQFGRYAAEHNWAQLKNSYRSGVTKITAATGIYLLLMMLTKEQFEALASAMLKVPSTTSEDLWWLCVLLAGYLHVAASGTLVVAVIQSLSDTKAPVRIAIIGFFLSLPLKVGGYLLFGIKGIVMGSTIHYIINMVIMTIYCERKLHDASTEHRKT